MSKGGADDWHTGERTSDVESSFCRRSEQEEIICFKCDTDLVGEH